MRQRVIEEVKCEGVTRRVAESSRVKSSEKEGKVGGQRTAVERLKVNEIEGREAGSAARNAAREGCSRAS